MNSVCCCCCCVLVRERHCWKQHIRMTRPSLFNDVSLHSYVLCGRMQIAHIRYVKILTWLRGFLVMFVYLVWFSLCFSFFWELRENGVVNNLQFCPLSLGVMLDFLDQTEPPPPPPFWGAGSGTGSGWSKKKGGRAPWDPPLDPPLKAGGQARRRVERRNLDARGSRAPIFESFA